MISVQKVGDPCRTRQWALRLHLADTFSWHVDSFLFAIADSSLQGIEIFFVREGAFTLRL